MASLSSLLVQRGVASMRGVEEAIARQVIHGGDLATNVLEVGAAREADVTHLAAESLGLVALAPGRIAPADPAVLRLLPGDVAARHGILPIEKRGGALVVATSQPLSQSVEEDLGFLLNLDLSPMYALRARIEQALAEQYGLPLERRYARLLAKLEGRKPAADTEPPARMPSQPPAARMPSRPPAAIEPAARAPGQPPAAEGAQEPDPPALITPARPTLRGIPHPSVDEAGALSSFDDAPAAAALPSTIELSARPPEAAPPGAAPPSAPARAEPAPHAIAAWARATDERARKEGRDRRAARARRKGPFPVALAEEEMQSAVTTEAVLEVLFDFAQQFFEYTALFVVHGDIAEGRDAAGRGADRDRVGAIGLPLDLPSTLAAARDRRVPVLADFTKTGMDAELLRDLGRAPATDVDPASPTAPARRAAAVVIPIIVRERAVALLFGDDAPAPVELAAIGDVIAFAALAGASIERIILRKKSGRSGGTSSARVAPEALAAAAKGAPARPAAPRSGSGAPPAASRSGVAALARMFSPAAPPAPSAQSSTTDPLGGRASTLAAAVVDSLIAPKGKGASAPPAAPAPIEALAEPEENTSAYATDGPPVPTAEQAAPEGAAPAAAPEPADESSGGAHTIALLVPDVTPEPEVERAGAVDAVETIEPDAVALAGETDAAAASTVRAPEPYGGAGAGMPEGAHASPSLAEADSAAETASLAVSEPPSDRPSITDEGRPSAPVVVDVSADASEGLSSAIARAAEAVRARAAQSGRPAQQADAALAAPPEETITDGFPAVAPDPAHVSPDLPPAAPFATPPPPASDEPSSQTPLDLLLARAARGAGAAAARAELTRRAERNLAPLLAAFPGPLDQDRHRSAERLPPASQCGPLLQAFAHAGARGAATVAVLARHDDVDVRFWAAHLLGEIPSPEAVDGLLSFIVDADPAVRRIALRSAASLLAASLPGRPLEAALGYLARDAHTPLRERLAAVDAMGQLRVGFFVPILIGLLSAIPEEVGESARRALLVVTRQDFGRDAARWNEWWSRNEGRHRLEWLIDALMHDAQSIRRAAGDELKQLTKEYFGYYDDLPKRERERAQERYREWWEREGRARFR